MSFRCNICNEPSANGVAPKRVVTHTRKKHYHANQSLILGSEIVREVNACAPCAEGIGEPIVELGDLPIEVISKELPEFEGNASYYD